MIVPEVRLKGLLDELLLLVEADYNSKTDKTESFLYRVFSGNSVDGYDYYEQAKAIFLRPKHNKRRVETRIFFDRDRCSFPTIHITMPSETPFKDGLGMDAGYVEPIFTDETFQEPLTRTYNTKFNIVMTSDNTFEVLIMYYCIRALIIANFESFEFNGIRNMKMSGQDLAINDALMPTNVYMRGLGLECFYEFSVPMINVKEMLSLIEFDTATIYPYANQALGDGNI